MTSMATLGGLTPADKRLIGASTVALAASASVYYAGAGRIAPFVVTGVALALLAALVGRSVDRLGDRLGSGATGVVQSALGNLPELFIGIFALRSGLIEVVQAALVGSILANLLLVLGPAFLAGGIRHGTQRFTAEAARLAVLLLVLSVAIIMVPTLSSHFGGAAAHHERALSNIASLVLLAVFALSIPASLKSATPKEQAQAGQERALAGMAGRGSSIRLERRRRIRLRLVHCGPHSGAHAAARVAGLRGPRHCGNRRQRRRKLCGH